MKNIDNPKIENGGAGFIEASLTGHYDHGKVICYVKKRDTYWYLIHDVISMLNYYIVTFRV